MRITFGRLCLALLITPHLLHGGRHGHAFTHQETRPVICSADLSEENRWCNKIALSALVKARVAVLFSCESRLARELLQAVLSLSDSHFRPRGGQSDDQLLQNSKVCVDGICPPQRFVISRCEGSHLQLQSCLCAPLSIQTS